MCPGRRIPRDPRILQGRSTLLPHRCEQFIDGGKFSNRFTDQSDVPSSGSWAERGKQHSTPRRQRKQRPTGGSRRQFHRRSKRHKSAEKDSRIFDDHRLAAGIFGGNALSPLHEEHVGRPTLDGQRPLVSGSSGTDESVLAADLHGIRGHFHRLARLGVAFHRAGTAPSHRLHYNGFQFTD